MSHVELVMEVCSSLTEVLLDFSVKSKSSLNDGDDLLLYSSLELREVLANECVVDGEQGGLFGEWNSNGPEVTLESGVDLERTSSRVHASCVQGILDILKSKLSAIIPMVVVLVLSQE